MKPTSQEPQQTPAPKPPSTPPPPPIGAMKKSKKPLIITLIVVFALLFAGVSTWLWWSSQPTDNDAKTSNVPAKNSEQQKVLAPSTIAYAYVEKTTA